jgi:hypothetical protein
MRVWDQRGCNVFSIGKLVRKHNGPKEVEQILAAMIKSKYVVTLTNLLALKCINDR